MKKLLIVSNLFWISLFIFSGFIKPSMPKNATADDGYHLIDASLAKLMAENYRNFYVNTFIKKKLTAAGTTIMDKTNGTQNGMDSRSVWFSIKVLEKYIQDMKTSSKMCNDSTPLSGLRFYFIKYPERKLEDSQNPWRKYGYFNNTNMPANYAERHSLMIVPTRHDSSNETEVDYDPRFCVAGKFTDLSTVMNNLISKELNNEITLSNPAGPDLSKAAFIMPDDSYTKSTAINRGSVSPPPNQYRVSGNTVVPCNGTSLMNFVDGYDNCGMQKIKISDAKDTKTKATPKVLLPE
jgi:hypothetical protein